MRFHRQSTKIIKMDTAPYLTEEDVSNDKNCIQWTSEEEMQLIKQIWNQIPENDTVPFDIRKAKLKWDLINVNEFKTDQIMQHFNRLIEKIRTFRILREILEDIRTVILSEAHVIKKPTDPLKLFLMENKKLLENAIDIAKTKKQKATEMFEALPEETKKAYTEQAETNRKENQVLISQFNFDKTLIRNRKQQNKKSLVVPDTPAFHYFKEKKGLNVLEKISIRDAKVAYSKLSTKRKLKWILRWLGVEKGNKLNARQYLRAKKNLSKDEMKLINTYENRPKKMNSYNFYMKEIISSKKDTPPLELFTFAANSWKSLSTMKKQHYIDLAKEAAVKYKYDYQQFIESLPEDRRAIEMNKPFIPKSRNKLSQLHKNNHSDQDETQSNLKNKKFSIKISQKRKLAPNKENEKCKVQSSIASYLESANNSIHNSKVLDEPEAMNMNSIESYLKPEAEEECETTQISKIKSKKRKLMKRTSSESDNYAQEITNLEDANKSMHSPKVLNDPEAMNMNSIKTLNSEVEEECATKQISKIKSKKRKLMKRTSSESDNYAQEIKNLEDANNSMPSPKIFNEPEALKMNSIESYLKPEAEEECETTQISKKKIKKHKSMKSTNSESDTYTQELKSSQKSNEYSAKEHFEKTIMKYNFNFQLPPDSLYKYFLTKVYNGDAEMALTAYRQLSKEEKEEINRKSVKAKKKALKKLEKFVKSIPIEEFQKFASYFNSLVADNFMANNNLMDFD